MTPREQHLQDRVEELEALLGVKMKLEDRRPFGMPRRTAQVFGVLLNRDLATREYIFSAVWGNDSNAEIEKNIDVHVCMIRKRIRPLGAKIESIYSIGYRIPSDDRKRLKAMLEMSI